MKVILLEDVKGLGERGDTVSVAAGYARNFLLPRNRALRATPAALRVAKELSKSAERREAEIREEALGKVKLFEDLTITIMVNVSEGGRLFGSVTATEIAKQISESGVDLEVDKHDVLLDEPIKQIGQYKVPVKIFRDVRGEVDVWVSPTEESRLAMEAAAKESKKPAPKAENEDEEAAGETDSEPAGDESEDAERATATE